MKGRFCLILFIGLLALCLASCSSSKDQKTAQGPQQLPPVTKLEPVPPPQKAQPMASQRPMTESIFFSTNSSKVTPQMQEVLKSQAAWFNQNPQQKIRISGNTDARGSEQFNQKLAQKRADAVKQHLVQLGVNPDRLETVSKGKDSPICTQATQDCYAVNRRVDVNAIG